MKKNIIMKAMTALVAISMLLTLTPAVLAEGENVIFPITVQQELGTGVPLAEGVTGVDITSPYKFLRGETAAYADESGTYDALDFFSQNATPDEKDNVNFGISFGDDISAYISDFSQVFLSFDFCPSAKADVSQIYVGSMYTENGEWVKRTPVSLAKYTGLTANKWKHLDFSLADLGITASDSAFEGIYFLYNNITIPSSGKLWDHVARAFNMQIVSSVGASNKTEIPVAEREEINLYDTAPRVLVPSAKLPQIPDAIMLGSGGSMTSGINCLGADTSKAGIADIDAYFEIPYRVSATQSAYFFETVSGNIENYNLVVTFTRGVGAREPIKDFEFGVGNANANSGYTSAPTVIRTLSVSDFGYTGAEKGTEFTVNVGSIKDILENGVKTEFPVEGKTINELTSTNINVFAMKVKTGANYGGNGTLATFTSIKLVASGIELESTTETGGDISWKAPEETPLCYSVFNSDGTKLCDTVDTTVPGTAGGTYSVYAYYGGENYSDELIIDTTAEPVEPSIASDGENIVFCFGSNAPKTAVAIFAEYTADFNKLINISIIPVSEASGNPKTATVPKPAAENGVKAFIFKDAETLNPLAVSFAAE